MEEKMPRALILFLCVIFPTLLNAGERNVTYTQPPIAGTTITPPPPAEKRENKPNLTIVDNGEEARTTVSLYTEKKKVSLDIFGGKVGVDCEDGDTSEGPSHLSVTNTAIHAPANPTINVGPCSGIRVYIGGTVYPTRLDGETVLTEFVVSDTSVNGVCTHKEGGKKILFACNDRHAKRQDTVIEETCYLDAAMKIKTPCF